MNGNASKKDLETMFQLIYLRFTQPRADVNAFNTQAAQTRAMLAKVKIVRNEFQNVSVPAPERHQ